MATVLKREEKEVPFRREHVLNPSELSSLCTEHQVRLILGDSGLISIVLTESSIGIEEFARKVLSSGCIKIPEDKRSAMFRDLSTLECP
jgi:hypothetical protein